MCVEKGRCSYGMNFEECQIFPCEFHESMRLLTQAQVREADLCDTVGVRSKKCANTPLKTVKCLSDVALYATARSGSACIDELPFDYILDTGSSVFATPHRRNLLEHTIRAEETPIKTGGGVTTAREYGAAYMTTACTRRGSMYDFRLEGLCNARA